MADHLFVILYLWQSSKRLLNIMFLCISSYLRRIIFIVEAFDI